MGWGQQLDMAREAGGGRWVLRRELPPGRFAYKLIVDGRWTCSADHPTFVVRGLFTIFRVLKTIHLLNFFTQNLQARRRTGAGARSHFWVRKPKPKSLWCAAAQPQQTLGAHVGCIRRHMRLCAVLICKRSVEHHL